MSRIYFGDIPAVTLAGTADDDFFEIAAITNKIRLLGWEVTSNITAATYMNMRLVRRSTTGTGTAGATPVELNVDGAAALSTYKVNLTAPGTVGDILGHFAWEQLGPLGMVYTPEMAPVVEAGSFIALNMVNAGGASIIHGWMCWEEI